MSDNLHESLSALMDGEADELARCRLLQALPGDKALWERWKRYHLISACLHQEMHSRPAVDLLEGIHAALESDPLPKRTFSRKPLGGFFRMLGQSAIAASMALVVLFAAQYLTSGENGAGPELAGSTSSPAVNSSGNFDPDMARTASLREESTLEPDAQERLRRAVYREFEQNADPYQDEIPLNYIPPLQ